MREQDSATCARVCARVLDRLHQTQTQLVLWYTEDSKFQFPPRVTLYAFGVHS